MISNYFCKNIGPHSIKELSLRDKISNEIVLDVLKGGIQTKVVHLTENYAIHELREYGSSSLDVSLRARLDRNKLLKYIDDYINKGNNIFLHEMKQKVKIILDLFQGKKEVLNRDKLYRTLNSHILACELDGLVDEFTFIANLKIRKKLSLNISKITMINYAIVKNRCEFFLDTVFDDLYSKDSIQDIKKIINKVFILEKELWKKHIFNTDLIFLGNIVIKNNNLLLRDLGALTNNLDMAVDFIINEASHQIQEQKNIIETKYSYELSEYYEKKAVELYTKTNLLKIWND